MAGETSHISTLMQTLDLAVTNPSVPQIVLLRGETGTGKTYHVQSFFDALARDRPGMWRPGLVPPWPPSGVREVRRLRKRVEPPTDLRDDAATPTFQWIGLASGPEETGFTDLSDSLRNQLKSGLESCLRTVERRDKIQKLIMTSILELGGALFQPLGVARSLKNQAQLALSIFDEDSARLDQTRSAVWKAVQTSGRADPGTPIIVVLDDAQSASEESLYCVSGLFSDSTYPQLEQEDRTFLPQTLDDVSPAPVMIICTTWDHRVSGAGFRDAFQQWLSEVQTLGLPTTEIECKAMDPQLAYGLTREVSELPEETRKRLVDHLTLMDPDGEQEVNKLVLAEALGLLEETCRNPLTNELGVSQQMIDKIPNHPDSPLQDRIEKLREHSDGHVANMLLEILARYDDSPPHALIDCLISQYPQNRNRILAGLAALDDQRLIRIEQPNEPLTSQENDFRRLQADNEIARFLRSKPATELVRQQTEQACVAMMSWFAEGSRVDEYERAPYLPLRQARPRLMYAAQLVMRCVDAQTNPAAYAGAWAVLKDRPLLPTGLPAHLLGFAHAADLSLGCPSEDVLKQTLTHYGSSGVSLALIDTYLRHTTHIRPDTQALLEAALTGMPENARVLNLLATVHEKAGDVQRLRATLEAGSRYPQVALRLAMFHAAQGDTQSALAILTPFNASSVECASARARLLAAEGRWEDAAEGLSVLAPQSDRLSDELADLYLQHQQPEAAVATLGRMVQLNARVIIKHSRLLRQLGRPQEATDLLRAMSDSNASVAVELAGLLRANGDVQAAIDTLTPHAQQQQAAIELARILDSDGRVKEAQNTLERFPGDSPHVAVELAGLLRANGDVQAAIDTLTPHAQQQQAAIELARILDSEGRVKEAQNTLERFPGRSPQVAVELATLLLRDEMYQSACTVLRPHASGNQEAAILLARTLQILDRPEEAMSYLTGLGASNPQVALQLAEELDKDGRREDAKAILDPHRSDHNAAVKLAQYCRDHGDVEEAIRILRPLAPGGGAADILLADLLQRRGDTQEARTLLEATSHKSQMAASRLAQLYRQQGDDDAAIEVLMRHAGQPNVDRQLFRILLELHRHEEALAVTKDPGPRLALEFLLGTAPQTPFDVRDSRMMRQAAYVLAHSGDVDAVKAFVHTHPTAKNVVLRTCDYLLLLQRMSSTPSLQQLLDTLWTAPQQQTVAHMLTQATRRWVQEMQKSPQTGGLLGFVSRCEVLSTIQGTDSTRNRPAVTVLRTICEVHPEMIERLRSISEYSPLAREVLPPPAVPDPSAL